MFETLVVQTAFLGDLLLGIPLFKKIKELHPEGRLTVVCRRGLGSFLIDAGVVDEVVEVDKSSRQDWRSAKAKLRGKDFDLLLCPHESVRSALFVFGLKAKTKIGFKAWFNGFIFDERVERPIKDPEALRQLSLLASESEQIGEKISAFEIQQKLAGGRFADGSLVPVPRELDMTVPALKKLREGRVQSAKPRAVLSPGSVWATKMWTAEGYKSVGQDLARRGFDIVITGSQSESELCVEIADAIPGAKSLAGKASLFETAKVLAESDLLICNDSGAMHLGACAGIPTVAIFGPTVLDFGYRPWNSDSDSDVVELDLNCRPCGSHGSQKCPLGHHACMRDLSPLRVLTAAEKLMKR